MSLDTRFSLQAKELELLRERLRQAESDREEAMKKTVQLEQSQQQDSSTEITPRRVAELEREQKHLRASNALTKVKYLISCVSIKLLVSSKALHVHLW